MCPPSSTYVLWPLCKCSPREQAIDLTSPSSETAALALLSSVEQKNNSKYKINLNIKEITIFIIPIIGYNVKIVQKSYLEN